MMRPSLVHTYVGTEARARSGVFSPSSQIEPSLCLDLEGKCHSSRCCCCRQAAGGISNAQGIPGGEEEVKCRSGSYRRASDATSIFGAEKTSESENCFFSFLSSSFILASTSL